MRRNIQRWRRNIGGNIGGRGASPNNKCHIVHVSTTWKFIFCPPTQFQYARYSPPTWTLFIAVSSLNSFRGCRIPWILNNVSSSLNLSRSSSRLSLSHYFQMREDPPNAFLSLSLSSSPKLSISPTMLQRQFGMPPDVGTDGGGLCTLSLVDSLALIFLVNKISWIFLSGEAVWSCWDFLNSFSMPLHCLITWYNTISTWWERIYDHVKTLSKAG